MSDLEPFDPTRGAHLLLEGGEREQETFSQVPLWLLILI